jgi:hypothetical protein
MIEVTVKSGFAWTDLIIPAGTILATISGVWVAYWLHRQRARKNLQRDKAEQILGEVVEIESYLEDLSKGKVKYNQLCESSNELKKQLSILEARIEIYLPQYLPPQDQKAPKENPENIINCFYMLRSAIEGFCIEVRTPRPVSIGEGRVERSPERKQVITDFFVELQMHVHTFSTFRDELRKHIQNTL